MLSPDSASLDSESSDSELPVYEAVVRLRSRDDVRVLLEQNTVDYEPSEGSMRFLVQLGPTSREPALTRWRAPLLALGFLSLAGCRDHYDLAGLPQPSGSQMSSPRRINEYNAAANRVQVAGYNQCAGAPSQACAYLWEASSFLVQTFDLAQMSGPGIDESQALGLNNVFPSKVVGWMRGPGTAPHQAVIWEKTSITKLPTLGGAQAEAWDVDDAGNVVGWAENSNGIERASFWPVGRSPQDLGTLGGANSQAVAMNNHGQVVGWAEDASGARHAFLWTPGGTDGTPTNPQMRDIHLANIATSRTTRTVFEGSTAIDVNDAGHVVGELTGTATLQGFFWSAGGGTVVLGDWTSAHGINNSDLIVGYAQPVAGGERSAVLWYTDFERRDLSSALALQVGWHLSVAEGINSHGDIVCWGFNKRNAGPDVLWGLVLYPKP